MRNRLSLIPLFLAMFAIFVGVPTAAQADYRDVYTDCSDGTIDGTFTAKELQQALQKVDAFAGDYSECSDAIFRAQQALASGQKRPQTSPGGSGTGTGSGTAGGTTTPSTPSAPSAAGGTVTTTTTTPDRQNDARDADAAEKAAALAAASAAAAADRKAGQEAAALKDTGVPAAALQVGSAETTLPGPLLLTLIACVFAACIAGGVTGVQALRRRRGR